MKAEPLGTRALLPLVKQKVDVPTLLLRIFEEDEYRGHLTFCPFHQHTRSTPSFHAFADGSRWKCFSCGAGGDVIDFWTRAYKQQTGKFLTFQEAVRSLALMAGLDASAATPQSLATIAQAIRVNPRGNPTELHQQLRAWGDEYLEPLFHAVRFCGLSGAWERASWLEANYDRALTSGGRPLSAILQEMRVLETLAFGFLRVAEEVGEILENGR